MFLIGFDEDLLNRFKVILGVISSQHFINVEAFRLYCYDTASKYVKKYKWYYMPTSMHVILIHGWRILEEILVPFGMYSMESLLGMGMFSEEAQEGYHKILKRFKDRFSRKISR